MIRLLHPDDLEQATHLCRELHAKSTFARYEPHWPTVVQTLVRLGTIPTGRVIVAENDGKLTGIMIALAQEYWWAEAKFGPRVVSDLLFYSRHIGDGKKMLETMIAWAWTVPRVVRVEMAISSGIKVARAEGFYRMLGLMPMGTMFEMTHPKMAEIAAGGSA